ncbi:MAG: DUF948 domain-containing protein [Coriobacteriia bacterium]|nr:DUF948 domain-containing protein [Coriobacteriia bacterium]
MEVLDIVLAAMLVVLIGVGIYATFLLVRTLGEARTFMTEMRERLTPLLKKADVTIDAVNAELLRLDGIVTQVEEVSGTVSSTTRVATEIIRSPMNKVAEVGSKLIGALRTRRR